MKAYLVYTNQVYNSEYSFLCLAENERKAIDMADECYTKKNGIWRTDWKAVQIDTYLEKYDKLMAVRVSAAY